MRGRLWAGAACVSLAVFGTTLISPMASAGPKRLTAAQAERALQAKIRARYSSQIGSRRIVADCRPGRRAATCEWDVFKNDNDAFNDASYGGDGSNGVARGRGTVRLTRSGRARVTRLSAEVAPELSELHTRGRIRQYVLDLYGSRYPGRTVFIHDCRRPAALQMTCAWGIVRSQEEAFDDPSAGPYHVEGVATVTQTRDGELLLRDF